MRPLSSGWAAHSSHPAHGAHGKAKMAAGRRNSRGGNKPFRIKIVTASLLGCCWLAALSLSTARRVPSGPMVPTVRIPPSEHPGQTGLEFVVATLDGGEGGQRAAPGQTAEHASDFVIVSRPTARVVAMQRVGDWARLEAQLVRSLGAMPMKPPARVLGRIARSCLSGRPPPWRDEPAIRALAMRSVIALLHLRRFSARSKEFDHALVSLSPRAAAGSPQMISLRFRRYAVSWPARDSERASVEPMGSVSRAPLEISSVAPSVALRRIAQASGLRIAFASGYRDRGSVSVKHSSATGEQLIEAIARACSLSLRSRPGRLEVSNVEHSGETAVEWVIARQAHLRASQLAGEVLAEMPGELRQTMLAGGTLLVKQLPVGCRGKLLKALKAKVEGENAYLCIRARGIANGPAHLRIPQHSDTPVLVAGGTRFPLRELTTDLRVLRQSEHGAIPSAEKRR